jgi:transposase
MAETLKTAVAVIGIDIGKNSFHVVGLDRRGAIVLRQRWSRGQVEARFANLPACLIGMEACVCRRGTFVPIRSDRAPG